MLRQQPRLKPMTLFEYLQDRYPGKYPQVLRTLQRRVQTWIVEALYIAATQDKETRLWQPISKLN